MGEELTDSFGFSAAILKLNIGLVQVWVLLSLTLEIRHAIEINLMEQDIDDSQRSLASMERCIVIYYMKRHRRTIVILDKTSLQYGVFRGLMQHSILQAMTAEFEEKRNSLRREPELPNRS